MKIRFPEIDSKRFYLIGKYSFFVIGLIGIIRMIEMWIILKSYDIVSSVASIIFNLALSRFFAYLQGKEDIKEVNDGDIFKMNEALDKLNLDGGIKNGKENRPKRRGRRKETEV